MNWTIIARPLVGAGIGYITNWIAVKMLFRPLKPIKIGKITLPFTPGIIPKNKERIAKSIGNTISDNLLTKEVLEKSLLSDETQEIISKKVSEALDNNHTIEEYIFKVTDESNYENIRKNIVDNLTDRILKIIKNMDIGEIISSQIENIAKEKMKGSMLKIFGGKSIVAKVSLEASQKIDEYIDKNGEELVSNIVETELNKFTHCTTSEIVAKMEKNGIDMNSAVLNLYEKIVLNKISDILKTVNISQIVTNKINSMDMLELEKLILEIMKNELNALVNLGAIIGFVLGLVNLLF